MKKRNKAVQKENILLDTFSLNDENLSPIVSPEEDAVIKKFFADNPALKSEKPKSDEPWIQTFSGRRFNPLNPNPDAIVIQDIAHALSNICRFTGHSSSFYSVAQHCVLVSYICNQENAMMGLLHDGSEAYCQDIASPIKKSPEFEAYRGVEAKIQNAIYTRFDLKNEEPADVKRADILLLATEARDLMSPLHPDWVNPIEPLPFKIVPLQPEEAEDLFLKRFYELFNSK